MIQNDAWIKQYKEELGTRESVSGVGSTVQNTAEIREHLPSIFKQYKIKSMVDIPCGDWNWMRLVDLSGIKYIGCDIVPQLVADNNAKYGNMFQLLDITKGVPPKADLLLCRDLLFHLPQREVEQALSNIYASGCRYFLTTTFKDVPNTDINTGSSIGWRKINLTASPYELPDPIYVIQENNSPACKGRTVGLFKGKI